MKYYHIRKYKKEKDNFHIGQELEFTPGKTNNLWTEIQGFDGYYLDHTTQDTNYWECLTHIFNVDLNTVDKATLNRMKRGLEAYVHNEGMFRRETILEEVRYKNYPTRPSRRSCMWLTDEECIDSWITLLEEKGTNYTVFEMNLDGNVFCSTDELLPHQESRIKEIEEQAKKYWNPTKEDLEKSIKREYLFEGIARVKKIYR